jgi:hypothetical protein
LGSLTSHNLIGFQVRLREEFYFTYLDVWHFLNSYAVLALRTSVLEQTVKYGYRIFVPTIADSNQYTMFIAITCKCGMGQVARSYQSYSDMLQHNSIIGGCIRSYRQTVHLEDLQRRNCLAKLMCSLNMCMILCHEDMLLGNDRVISKYTMALVM